MRPIGKFRLSGFLTPLDKLIPTYDFLNQYMMMKTERDGIRDIIDVVTRRADYIESVVDEPKDQRDLRNELDVSRSTVYKAVRELEDLGVLERSDGGYRPTLRGRLFFEEYRGFHAAVAAVDRPGSLLSFLPADTAITADVLAGATIHRTERHAPHGPVRVIEAAVREATVLYGTAPVVLPRYVEVFHEQLVAGDLEAELVFERPVIEHLSEEYGTQFTEALQAGRLVLWGTEEVLPFGLAVIEEPTQQLFVIVYDPGGDLQGVITNDSETAIEWGRLAWNACRDSATRVGPDHL